MCLSWRRCTPGSGKARILLAIVVLGVCLCVLPWLLDWVKGGHYYEIDRIVKGQSDVWQNRGNLATTLSDKGRSYAHSAGAPGETYTFGANLTRIYTVSTRRPLPWTTRKTNNDDDKVKVIIGLAITSTGLTDITPGNLRSKFAFFRYLLPSFCKTASGGYHYGFYLGYDHNDTFFSQDHKVKAFANTFHVVSTQICAEDLTLELQLVKCDHAKRPAWAQNDAMLQGYLDGGEYFYRVNDDTQMETPGWLQDFLSLLQLHTPPNVGVVGPRHVGGNNAVLTYDFVHRTHVDIFGFYYPRVFRDWFADDWITKVYEPGRTTKARKIWLKHTMEYGQRYTGSPLVGAKLKDQVAADRKILNRYIQARETPPPNPHAGKGNQVIAMSLHGSKMAHTYGALRNAQLIKVFFPGWTLRIYTCDNRDSKFHVPPRILQNLDSLGAQIRYVTEEQVQRISPKHWSFLVADDQEVEYFLIRNPEHRLSDRDALAVSKWVQTDSGVVCMRDHPRHSDQPVVDGLWGGRPSTMRTFLKASMETMLMKNVLDTDPSVLGTLWKILGPHSICYDSVSCQKWPSTVPFPRSVGEENQYLEQVFDQFHNPVNRTERVVYQRNTHQCIDNSVNSSVTASVVDGA